MKSERGTASLILGEGCAVRVADENEPDVWCDLWKGCAYGEFAGIWNASGLVMSRALWKRRFVLSTDCTLSSIHKLRVFFSFFFLRRCIYWLVEHLSVQLRLIR
ncbi:unnamed protein product [Ixodes persulcatus]